MNYKKIKKESSFVYFILKGGNRLGQIYLKVLKEVEEGFLNQLPFQIPFDKYDNIYINRSNNTWTYTYEK